MSKHKNVNPDHYKTGGSLPQGDDVVQERHRKQLAEERAATERWQKQKQSRPEDTKPSRKGGGKASDS